MNTLADEFNFYCERVYRGSAPDPQVRAAFFAGTLVALRLAIQDTRQMPVQEAEREIMALIDESKNTCDKIFCG